MRIRKLETGGRNVRSRKRREQGQKNTEGHYATGGLPKPQSGTPEEERDRGCSERQEPRRAKKKKTVAKIPKSRGKERCQEKETDRAEGSHTDKRRGAQRQTMKPNPGNKWQVKAPDPGAQRKEQKPKAKVILRSRSRGKGNTLDPKGDPIPKEYQ